ncbi:MAG: hypothetical protein L3J25_06205 [Flavobacteriaceae bacterium]|nr:hypothetical protein [Flavobacteriaceae bacterium]
MTTNPDKRLKAHNTVKRHIQKSSDLGNVSILKK